MLNHIQIQNFTIIDQISLDLSAGMTVLTGETGAGKSILIDALSLALGGRADNKVIRHGTQRCDITATFDISSVIAAQKWLSEHDLNNDNDCILRRVINVDGPSRSFINGQPMPLQLVRELGDLLVDIHGQHEHHSLLKRDVQRQLLDDFAGHADFLAKTQSLYQQWRTTTQNYNDLLTRSRDQAARSEFLRFQVQELSQLDLSEKELESLDKEHKQLANMGELINNCQHALTVLHEKEDDNALQLLKQAQAALATLKHLDEKISTSSELLDSAIIQTQEAVDELNHYVDKLELNPHRLQEIEQRLVDIHNISRKHRVKPEEIPTLLQQFVNELQQLENSNQNLQVLQEKLQSLEKEYHSVAIQLSNSRQKVAKKLSKNIQESMQQLGMPGGKFDIQLETIKDSLINPYGLERIEFVVSANPGQPLQSLAKVASGGELSRISLAIQVITAQTNVTPTLIFDEVDVGIGGSTAAIVGQLLRQLGNTAQVLCVTHLAQVAAQGHHHLQVNKFTEKNQTRTQINQLNVEEKIQEIARMIGGMKITKQTLAHAKEMLELSI